MRRNECKLCVEKHFPFYAVSKPHFKHKNGGGVLSVRRRELSNNETVGKGVRDSKVRREAGCF